MKILSTFKDLQDVKNKLDQEAHTAYLESGKTLNYHDHIGRAFAEDQTAFAAYNPAIATGATNAYDLQRAYRDHTNPDHARALATFKDNQFDFDKIAIDCVNKAIKSSNARKLESKNASYEKAVLDACVPSQNDADDSGMINKLKATFRQKWEDRGYENPSDAIVFKNFMADNKLSSSEIVEKGITQVVNSYFGEHHLLNAIAAYKPSFVKDKMQALRTETEDDEKRKKQREKEAVELAKKGAFKS